MSNRELIHRASEMDREIALLRAALRGGALQRIDEAKGGLRASRFDAISRSGAVADPTGSLALRERDLAARHADELGMAMSQAAAALGRALAVIALYPPPRVADVADRAALERVNGREPGCENCSQLILESGARRWEPIDSAMTEATTVGGVLDAPMLLCQWCRKRTSAWGRLPSADELERHHRGERVAWPADVARPA